MLKSNKNFKNLKNLTVEIPEYIPSEDVQTKKKSPLGDASASVQT
jgi:hypothetical protein